VFEKKCRRALKNRPKFRKNIALARSSTCSESDEKAMNGCAIVLSMIGDSIPSLARTKKKAFRRNAKKMSNSEDLKEKEVVWAQSQKKIWGKFLGKVEMSNMRLQFQSLKWLRPRLRPELRIPCLRHASARISSFTTLKRLERVQSSTML
jgi:hypothetical protein